MLTGLMVLKHFDTAFIEWTSLPSQLSDNLLASYELYLFTFESDAQFAKTVKQCDECFCFMLSFACHAAHSSDKVAKVNYHSEQMFDELEKKYPAAFSMAMYPI